MGWWDAAAAVAGVWIKYRIESGAAARREAEAARLRAEESRLKTERQRSEDINNVGEALVYWSTKGRNLDHYVATHWREVLAAEADLHRKWRDPEGAFHTRQRRERLARFALSECKEILGRLLTPEELGLLELKPLEFVTNLLTHFHADPVERMLPGAHRARDEAEGLIPAPVDPADPLAAFPADTRNELRRRLSEVAGLRALDSALDQEHLTFLAALERKQLPSAEHAREVERNLANLQKVREEFGAARGWLS